MIKNKRLLGEKAESKAIVYLEKKGYQIVDRNYHAGKLGEIDLIMENDEYLVFIEVKYAKTDQFGLPHYKVDIKKQKQILKVAEVYLAEYETSKDCRLDAVLIYEKNNDEIIEHIEDAFRG